MTDYFNVWPAVAMEVYGQDSRGLQDRGFVKGRSDGMLCRGPGCPPAIAIKHDVFWLETVSGHVLFEGF